MSCPVNTEISDHGNRHSFIKIHNKLKAPNNATKQLET